MIGEGITNFLESELEQLQIDFLLRIKLYASHYKTNLGQLIAEIDFFNELQEAGLTNVINKVESEYAGIIDSIVKDAKKLNLGVSGATLQELEELMNLDADNILNSAKTFSNQYKSAMIRGYISGQDTNEIVSNLNNIPLKTNQLIAAINTGREEFHATALADLFQDAPDIKFVLAGPLDNRTRCQCRAVLLNQPKQGWTKKEIDSGVATRIALEHCPKFDDRYNFIKRGGFNCRHWWQLPV